MLLHVRGRHPMHKWVTAAKAAMKQGRVEARTHVLIQLHTLGEFCMIASASAHSVWHKNLPLPRACLASEHALQS